jgi:phage terminase large subunit-like protein
MTEALEDNTLVRWRQRPVEFIREVLRDPMTGRPFELFEAQEQFFAHAWQTDGNGRLKYPEQCFGAIKKSAKTGTAAAHVLTTTLVFGGRYSEGYCLSNDLEQAQGRVFAEVRKICESSPILRREAQITQSRISFPQTGAVIQAIGSDYASAAGAHPTISSFDELWAFSSERSRRLYDEMVPVPTRKISCRLVTTHAGFDEGELLYELYKRGMALPEVAPSLHAGDGMLLAWHTQPVAPWQTDAWLQEMRRSLRPAQFQRMIQNQFVSSESVFIDMCWWDRCTDPQARPVVQDPQLSVWVGVDASTKRDSTAIVACTWDRTAKQVKLVQHRVFQPSSEQPLDFELCVEHTLLALKQRFDVRQVLFDPYQMAASAQRLKREGLRIEEYPQTTANLTEASQNLYELIKHRNLVVYPDDALRLAISRAVAVESSRGWRLDKLRQSHKIDVVVALGMAALAAVKHQSTYRWEHDFVHGPEQPPEDPEIVRERRERLKALLLSGQAIPF